MAMSISLQLYARPTGQSCPMKVSQSSNPSFF